MTIEEITQTLERVAENQARQADLSAGHSERIAEMEKRQAEHLANMARLDEAHARHTADIAEIDKMFAASLESQNRYDRQLGRLFEVVGDLADRQLKNEELFAELAASRDRHEVRMGQLEASYELFESFVRDFREESRDNFAETDRKLAALAGVQAGTSEILADFVKETNGRFTETDRKLAALAESQARTDEQMRRTDDQIMALILSQTRTDEMVRSLVERNGAPKAKAKKKAGSKKPAAKKASKKGGAK